MTVYDGFRDAGRARSVPFTLAPRIATVQRNFKFTYTTNNGSLRASEKDLL